MDKNNHPAGCTCENCNNKMNVWSMHRRHILLRMLVLIVLVVFVFWLGFQLGEMKGFLISNGGGYQNDGGMMMRDGRMNEMNGGMMRTGAMPANGSTVSPAVPVNPATGR